MITRYVNLGSTAGGTGITNETTGTDRAYASLAAAVDAVPDSPADAYTIICTKGSGGVDTVSVGQTEWSQTTTASNYILVKAADGDRATMPHDSGRYTLEVTNGPGIYNNYPGHVRIDGLQVHCIVTNAGTYIGINLLNANIDDADIDLRIENCVVRATETSGVILGITSRDLSGSGTSVIKNCAVYNCNQGIYTLEAVPEAYNCTVGNCTYGFVSEAYSLFRNCLATGCAQGFLGNFHASSNYNAEDDGNGAPGANSYSGTTFTFVNAAGRDYHLAPSDTGAMNRGIGPGGDAKVPTTDIDGDSRSGATCDIGADEYAAPPEGSVTYEAFIGGPQACPIWVSPSLVLMNSWDATLKKISGTDRTIAWSIRNVASGAITEAFAESQSITTTQHSLPRDATYDYASTQAGDGLYQVMLDVSALTSLDLFRFRIYEETAV